MRRKPNIKQITCRTCRGTGGYLSGCHLISCPQCWGVGREPACPQKDEHEKRERGRNGRN
jgi:DnaJ-class molecular chaperone